MGVFILYFLLYTQWAAVRTYLGNVQPNRNEKKNIDRIFLGKSFVLLDAFLACYETSSTKMSLCSFINQACHPWILISLIERSFTTVITFSLIFTGVLLYQHLANPLRQSSLCHFSLLRKHCSLEEK